MIGWSCSRRMPRSEQPRIVRRDEAVTQIEVPRLKIYSLLVLGRER